MTTYCTGMLSCAFFSSFICMYTCDPYPFVHLLTICTWLLSLQFVWDILESRMITVQNLVAIDAVVSKICNFDFFSILWLENAYSLSKNHGLEEFDPFKWRAVSTNPPKGTSLCKSTSFEPSSIGEFPKNTHTHTHTTILQLSGLCPWQPEWASNRRNIHPLTPIVVISHPLSASSIDYNPWHLPYSIYMPDKSFHNLSPSFLWSISWPGTLNFVLHTFVHPVHCLLFTAHAHTIATCFSVFRWHVECRRRCWCSCGDQNSNWMEKIQAVGSIAYQ